MAGEQPSQLPPEDTIERFDYMLDGYEAEVRLSERFDIDLDSVSFYRLMLRAAYQRALERMDGDARNEG